jgi:small-conductance mechanosensitive channel
MSPRIYQGLTVLLEEGLALVVLALVALVVLGWLARRAAALPLLRRYPAQIAAAARQLRGLVGRATLVLFLGAAAFNAYLLFYLHADVPVYMRELVPRLGADTLSALGKRAGYTLLLGYGVHLASGWIARGLAAVRTRKAAFARAQIGEADMETLLARLDDVRRHGAILFFLWAASVLLDLPPVISRVLLTVLHIYLIVGVSRLSVILAVVLVQVADYLAQRYLVGETASEMHEQIRALKTLLTRSLEYIFYVSAASLALMQVDSTAHYATYGPVAVEIIGIFFLSRVIIAVFNLLMDRMFLVRRDLNDYQWQQRQTLVPLFKSVCKYMVFFTAVLLSLAAWGVNTTPVLAALGGAGIVVGLGAQPVINDLVSGLFILFENVYLVGDYVEIGKARGIVEGIDIRTTRVRGDPGGEIYVIRNGQINNVNSYSKDYVYAIVNVGVDYGEDLGRVFALLEEVGKTQAAESPRVLAPAEIMGVQKFDPGAMMVRVVIKSRPGQHGPVARQYRRMIKDAFDRAGIEMPFASTVVSLRGAVTTAQASDAPRSTPETP